MGRRLAREIEDDDTAGLLPARYEQRWAWVRPAWFLRFELEAIK